MCTIAILIGIDGAPPIVVAANRDELYARSTRPPERLGAGIAGGVDEVSGGTWLAINRDGRFVAVTNQRALDTPPPGLRSRGLIVRELASAPDPDGYVAAIDPTAYASMNLVWGDAERGVRIAYMRREGGSGGGSGGGSAGGAGGGGSKEVLELGRGVHVLCNDRIHAPGFPRGDRLETQINRIHVGDRAWPALWPQLARLLGDHTRVELADVPPSHLPPELARELTATCIHSETYGTRSASLVALDRGRVSAYLHADGPPCVTAFVDRMELLS